MNDFIRLDGKHVPEYHKIDPERIRFAPPALVEFARPFVDTKAIEEQLLRRCRNAELELKAAQDTIALFGPAGGDIDEDAA